ncbi:MAG: hypothetical protein E7607_04020 [Ruminococcaceae bacterium]|nr:hypothetical protein [Oscillospiraceae bacterium]
MKKIIAVILSVIMLVSVCLPVLATDPAPAAVDVSAKPTLPTDGHTFDNDFYFIEGIEEAPHSFETWVYLPADWDTSKRPGTLLSSYAGSTNSPYIHFDLYSKSGNIIPRIEIKDVYDTTVSSAMSISFPGIAVNPGEWTHIAISYDPSTGKATGYKNGAFVETPTATINNTYGDFDDRSVDYPLAIGADMRPSLDQIFKGSIYSMSIFEGQRTAAEVASAYANGPDLNDPNLMGHFVLDNTGNDIEDLSNSSLNLWLDYSKLWSEAPSITDSDYSFAFIPDIQYLIENDAAFGTTQVKNMHQWIVDNIDNKNIKYVMGLGDITEVNIPQQWETAYNSIAGVLNGKIDYSVINGNHDYKTGDKSTTYLPDGSTVTVDKLAGGTSINDYFGKDEIYTSQFTEANGGGTYADGDYRNTYRKMTIGSTKWLFIHLDWDPTDEVLKWAGNLAKNNPDYKVLVTTHNYMHGDGQLTDAERTSSKVYNNNGVDIWNEFVSLYENIAIVVSGHQEYNCVTMTQSKGVNGNTVSQFLIDTQMIDASMMGGRKTSGVHGYGKDSEGLGMVTLFHFTEDGSEVQIEHYSVLKDKYFMDVNQFSFDMNANKDEPNNTWGGHSIVPEGSGTQADPYIIRNGGNLIWMSKQIASANITSGSSVSFAGKYFKQVCDIDLAKSAIKSIGYYHTTQGNNVSATAFGGHYDGGGFSIKNGRVVSATTGYGVNINWCGGLFGAIYGATIENLTLDNMKIYSRGVTGGIVGRAIAPNDGSATEGFNKIYNCHVTNTCEINAWLPVGKTLGTASDLTVDFYDSRYNVGAVGAICGMAYATTIDGCSSDADIKVDANHGLVGGIVATAGYNSKINYCRFTGSITLTDGSDIVDGKNGDLVPFTAGGIVGLYAPNSTTNTMYPDDNFDGSLTISNCYNTGTFAYTDNENASRKVQIGGILGHAHNLMEGFSYTVDNCHNVAALTAPADCTDVSVNGIIGVADATTATFTVTNSYAGGDAVIPDASTEAMDEIDAVIKGNVSGFSLNGTIYATLSEAIAAANAGDTIYMMSDMTSAETSQIVISKSITIDGKGHTLTLGYAVSGNCGLKITSDCFFKNFNLITAPKAGVFELGKGTLNLQNVTAESKQAAVLYVNPTAATNIILDNSVAKLPADAMANKVVLYWKGGSYNHTATLKNGSEFIDNSKPYSNLRSDYQNHIVYTSSTTANFTLNLESGSKIISDNAADSTNDRVSGFIHYKGNGSNIGITVNVQEGSYFVMKTPASVSNVICPFYRGNPYSEFNIPHGGILMEHASTDYTKIWHISDGWYYMSKVPSHVVTIDGVTYDAYDYEKRIVYGGIRYMDVNNGTGHLGFTDLITAALNEGTGTSKVITLDGDFFNTTGLVVPKDTTLVIDLNGYTMYSAGDTYMFRHIYGNLIIKNGTLQCAAGLWVDNCGSITLDNVTAILTPNTSYTESSGVAYSRPLLKAVKGDNYVDGDVATITVNNSTLINRSNSECTIVVMDSGTANVSLEGKTKLLTEMYVKKGAAAQNIAAISVQTSGNINLTVGSETEIIMAPVTDGKSATAAISAIVDHTNGSCNLTFETGSKVRIERDGKIESSSYFVREYNANGTTAVIDKGVTLSTNAIAATIGDSGIIFPEFIRENNTFVGFAVNGKIYAGGDNYKNSGAKDDVVISAVYLNANNFDMLDGAAIRTTDGSGVRFTTNVSDEIFDILGSNASFGTIIGNVSMLTTDSVLTAPTLDCNKNAIVVIKQTKRSGEAYRAALIGIPDTAKAYGVQFAGRGYVTVTYANGNAETFYTAFDDNNVRSMYDIASNLLAMHNDTVNYPDDKYRLSSENLSVVNSIISTVNNSNG